MRNKETFLFDWNRTRQELRKQEILHMKLDMEMLFFLSKKVKKVIREGEPQDYKTFSWSSHNIGSM
jgi:hypothetical protein